MMHRAGLLFVIAGLGLGCSPGDKPARDKALPATQPSDPNAPDPKAPEPDRAPESNPPAQPDSPPAGNLELGPSATNDRQARSDAVLALLVDGETAARLPVLDTDPGRAFDPQLATALAPVAKLSKIEVDTPEVEGALDGAVVRRVILAHANEIRHCFDVAMVEPRTLNSGGRIDFVIAADGTVSESALTEPDNLNAAVEACVTKAVTRWAFPTPSDDEPVTVNCPFTVSPG